MKRECNSNETKFKLAQTKLFQINQLMTGISAYVPVAFDREYAAICNCTIHGSLIEYKFRIRHLGLDSDRKGNQTFMENGILVELKNEEEDPEKEQIEGKPQNPIDETANIPQNLAEFFFKDFHHGEMMMTEEKVQAAYDEYTAIMGEVYTRGRDRFKKLSFRAVNTTSDLE